MRLGTRWAVGAQIPAVVPPVLRPTLAEVEATLAPASPPHMWTLTFLEGRPIAELDTGVTVALRPSGDVVIGHADDDPYEG